MKKYSSEDLHNLIGKPVFVKVVGTDNYFKSGWATLHLNRNINAYYALNQQSYPISAYFNSKFELYDSEN